MNRLDEQLNRLFRSASHVEDTVATMPFGLETRALAAWRESLAVPVGIWNTPLLVRGFVLATVIMAISLYPALTTGTNTSNTFGDFLQLTDSTVPSDATP